MASVASIKTVPRLPQTATRKLPDTTKFEKVISGDFAGCYALGDALIIDPILYNTLLRATSAQQQLILKREMIRAANTNPTYMLSDQYLKQRPDIRRVIPQFQPPVGAEGLLPAGVTWTGRNPATGELTPSIIIISIDTIRRVSSKNDGAIKALYGAQYQKPVELDVLWATVHELGHVLDMAKGDVLTSADVPRAEMYAQAYYGKVFEEMGLQPYIRAKMLEDWFIFSSYLWLSFAGKVGTPDQRLNQEQKELFTGIQHLTKSYSSFFNVGNQKEPFATLGRVTNPDEINVLGETIGGSREDILNAFKKNSEVVTFVKNGFDRMNAQKNASAIHPETFLFLQDISLLIAYHMVRDYWHKLTPTGQDLLTRMLYVHHQAKGGATTYLPLFSKNAPQLSMKPVMDGIAKVKAQTQGHQDLGKMAYWWPGKANPFTL